jgi:hypothetical protein
MTGTKIVVKIYTAYVRLLPSDTSSYAVETDVGLTNNESRRILRCWRHIVVDNYR